MSDNRENFIEKSIKLHGDIFDYSKFKYTGSKDKSILICKKCKIEFQTTPSNNLLGKKCKNCHDMSRKCNPDELIKEFNKVHKGWKYNFKTYDNYHSKMEMVCPNNHINLISPMDHLRKKYCDICKSDIINQKNKIKIENRNLTVLNNIKSNILKCICNRCKHTIKGKFINLKNFKCKYCFLIDKIDILKNKHYQLVEILGNKTKIICNNGHFYTQSISNLKSNRKCNKCFLESKIITKEILLEKFKKIHGKLFTYNLDNYHSTDSKIEIKCRNNHTFYQKASNHLQGKGCRICSESSGERTITKILESTNITYIREKIFENCKNIYHLKFDFYLPDYNICIEYDGIQHFNPVQIFGGISTFKKMKINDEIKNKYCDNNNIKLLRISYLENIEEKLLDYINKLIILQC